MTVSPQTAPLRFSTLDEALAGLRGAGLRLSGARRLVLEALFAAGRPVSAEQLAAELDGAADLASVYRNLDTLERHGVVRHVHLGHGPGLYALAGDGAREYLACHRCGAVRETAPGELDAIREHIRVTFGFVARFGHFPIVGLCATCAAEATPHRTEGGHAHS